MPCQGPFTGDVEKLAQEATDAVMTMLEQKYRIISKEERHRSLFKDMFTEGETQLKEALVELLTADRYDGF